MWTSLIQRVTNARFLRTKLTVLYAGLFGFVLLLISFAVYSAVSDAATRQTRREMVASGTVFDRVWQLRSEQMRQGAALLARDFGFREAIATADKATIASAADNLRGRLGADLAFIVLVDGSTISSKPLSLEGHTSSLLATLNASERPSGVYVLGAIPYQVVAMPIMSPDLVGWIVFAVRLDAAAMTDLERLSAIPIQANVAHREKGRWNLAQTNSKEGRSRLSGLLDQALTNPSHIPMTVSTPSGDAITLVKPLPPLTTQDHSALVLTYQVSLALAPYRPLMVTLAAASLFGLILVIVGSWGLARKLTAPISLLDQAVGRLQSGGEVQVAIQAQDEIGRLASNFNHMATEIRARERRITHLAIHDAETGLGNRLSLEQALQSRLGVPDAQQFLAVFGIDRFDHVRGAIGYALAAQVVREVGERLAELHPSGVVARLSTDLLGLVFEARDVFDAEASTTEWLSRLEQPLMIAGDEIDVTMTVGLASSTENAPVADMIERANVALDQARSRRSKVGTFDAKAYGDPASNLALMSGMLAALSSGAMELYHQPKFDLRRRSINAVEGLVRWHHPVRGMLRPDLFIPMAEETGHVRALTDWVLTQAIEDQITLAKAGHDLEVSINVSGRLLGDHGFADFVERVIPRAVGKLCFEITETAVIENPTLGFEILERFRNCGIAISIDDFGSGLSSLAYLKQIRGQELKIDRSLIVDIMQSQRDALIVRSTIELAHGLGMKVTAEGVEDANALQILAAMGCDSIQGYLIARPQPLGRLMDFLNEESQARAFG